MECPAIEFALYEINPSVRPIAEHLFTYLRNSQAQISFAEGDARKSLEQDAPQKFDVLVIDAFSGDAIPLHLLTKEAMALYQRHLSAGGVLAFHVSNQHVDLQPEIALLAKEGQMTAVTVSSPPNEQRGAFKSTWVLVTNNQAFLEQPEVASKARITRENPKVRLWTDDLLKPAADPSLVAGAASDPASTACGRSSGRSYVTSVTADECATMYPYYYGSPLQSRDTPATSGPFRGSRICDAALCGRLGAAGAHLLSDAPEAFCSCLQGISDFADWFLLQSCSG